MLVLPDVSCLSRGSVQIVYVSPTLWRHCIAAPSESSGGPTRIPGCALRFSVPVRHCRYFPLSPRPLQSAPSGGFMNCKSDISQGCLPSARVKPYHPLLQTQSPPSWSSYHAGSLLSGSGCGLFLCTVSFFRFSPFRPLPLPPPPQQCPVSPQPELHPCLFFSFSVPVLPPLSARMVFVVSSALAHFF